MARKSRKNTAATDIYITDDLYIHVALYIRLSVEDGNNRSYSIETQRVILESYIEGKPEFMIHDVYIDNGCSGTNFIRPAFQRMLADIEAGRVNCVIVKDTSRLGRNTIDTGYYMERYFPANKVRFISINDNFDSDSPNNHNGGIILPLKNMINEAYAMDIGRKIKTQKQQAIREGKFIGSRAPYGYRKDPNDSHRLVVDSEAAAVVQQIFQWAYEGRYIIEIVKLLNAAGILQPSHYKKNTGEINHEKLLGKGAWKSCAVRRILTNEVYIGVMAQGKTKTIDHKQVRVGNENIVTVPGTHEAIIGKDMFGAVNRRLEQVAKECKQRGRKSNPPNIFKGKLFCAHCGRSLQRQHYERKTIPDTYVYKCLTNSQVLTGSCVGTSIDERILVTAVLDELRTILSATLDGFTFVLKGTAEQQKRLAELEAELNESRARLSEHNRYIPIMYEDLQRGVLSSEEYMMLQDKRKAEIIKTTADVSALEESIAAFEGYIAKHSELRLLTTKLNRSRKLSAEMLDVVERIDVDKDKKVSIKTLFDSDLAQLNEVCQK